MWQFTPQFSHFRWKSSDRQRKVPQFAFPVRFLASIDIAISSVSRSIDWFWLIGSSAHDHTRLKICSLRNYESRGRELFLLMFYSPLQPQRPNNFSYRPPLLPSISYIFLPSDVFFICCINCLRFRLKIWSFPTLLPRSLYPRLLPINRTV